MLSAKLKKLIYVALFIIFSASIYAAATTDLANRFLDKAETAYDDGNLIDAYKYINQALTVNKNGDIDTNILIFARSIYKQCLTDMKTNYDEQFYIDIVQNLEKYSVVENADLRKLVKQVQAIQDQKKEDEAAAQRAKQERMNQESLDAMKQQSDIMRAQSEENAKQREEDAKRQEALMAEMRKGFEDSAEAQKQAAKASQEMAQAQKDALASNRDMVEELKRGNENNQKSTKTILFLIIGIVILILFIVFIAVLLARRGFKNQQIQQEQYVQAFRQLAAGLEHPVDAPEAVVDRR